MSGEQGRPTSGPAVPPLGQLAARGGRYTCPAESCDWRSEEVAVSTSAMQHDAAWLGVGREVRAHLESHTAEDWVATVVQLRGERDHAVEALRRLTNAVQAKASRGTWPGPAWAEDSAPPLQARRASARRDRRPLWRRLGFDSDRED